MFYFCSKENFIGLITKTFSNIKRFLTNAVALLLKIVCVCRVLKRGGGERCGVLHKPLPKIAQMFSSPILNLFNSITAGQSMCK